MPRKLSYIFPAGNTQDICATQQQNVGDGALILNGNLVDPLTHTVSFMTRGYSRQVSITSTNDLSAINFTVKGTQNGVPITEIIGGPGGPANPTVYTDETFDIVTSITPSAPIVTPNTVSVGTGWKGFFPLITINPWPKEINYSISVSPLVAGSAAQAAVYGSLDKLFYNGRTFVNNLPGSTPNVNNPAVFTLEAMTNTPFVYASPGRAILNVLLIQVGSLPNSVGYATEMTFTQFSST